MIGLHAWLAREAMRRARRPGLASVLWLGRGAGYAWLRLWPLLVSLGLRSALHAAELYLLFLAVPRDDLAPLFALRTGLSLAASAHWGALEPLRREVRALLAARQPMAARERIGRALGAGRWLGALPLMACSAWVVRELIVGEGLSLATAYAWACALRLALELQARTYHAGIYACRRVYRPLWSNSAGDAASLGLIVLGFRVLGPFSVPLAIAASAALDAALTRRYARSAYRLARLPPPRAQPLRPGPSQLWAATRAALPPALANLALQLDALLLLVLLDADPPRDAGLSLTALLYVLRPWLGLASRWVRVFYFDVARLERGALRALRAHLRRYLLRVALACAALVAAGVVACAWLLGPPSPGPELACLLALVLARAWLAPAQLEAFVRGRHWLLGGAALVFALALQLMAAWLPSAPLVVSFAALLYALGALSLPAPLTASEPASAVCSPSEWLARAARTQLGQIAVLRVARGAQPASHVARALASADSAYSVCAIGRVCLLLSAAEAPALSLSRLLVASAGLLDHVQVGVRGSPRVQLERERQRASLPAELARALEPGRSHAQLLAEFARAFPAGRALDLQRGVGHLRGLVTSVSQLTELQALLAAEHAERKPVRAGRAPVSLALYAPRGRARWLFVCARGTPGFAAFHARVREASWHASLYEEPTCSAVRVGSRSREARTLQRRLGAHDL